MAKFLVGPPSLVSTSIPWALHPKSAIWGVIFPTPGSKTTSKASWPYFPTYPRIGSIGHLILSLPNNHATTCEPLPANLRREIPTLSLMEPCKEAAEDTWRGRSWMLGCNGRSQHHSHLHPQHPRRNSEEKMPGMGAWFKMLKLGVPGFFSDKA